MNLQRPLTFFAGLGILSALLIINHWIFMTWFNTMHLKWYLANGALIGLVSTIASLAWGDMNKHVGLISAHPFDYIGSCLQLVGLPVYTMGTHLVSAQGQPETRSLFDRLLTIPLVLMLFGALIIWLAVIVPPQYFMYLICGAPARTFSQSKRQPVAQLKKARLEVREIDNDEKVPEGWWSASLSQKPVAITNLFVALLFLIVKPLIGS